MDEALSATGTSAAAVGLDKLGQVGLLYHGLKVLGSGSILTGLVLGAVGVLVIEKKVEEASAFTLSGAVARLLRLLHGEEIGFRGSPHGRDRLRDRRRIPVRLEPLGRDRGGVGGADGGRRGPAK